MGGTRSVNTTTCATLSTIKSIAVSVFGSGTPTTAYVLGEIDAIHLQIELGNTSAAQQKTRALVSYIQDKSQQGLVVGSVEQLQSLISNLLCHAGLPADTFLITPSSGPQVLQTGDGQAGISVAANTVTQPTVITILVVPPAPGLLDTKLDQYPGYVSLTQSSGLAKPVVVGVCPSSAPPEVLDRLRLGHQTTHGFEITPTADASFLTCAGPGSVAQRQGRVRGWLASLAKLVVPTPLHARTRVLIGGVGGLATEFSIFAPVDVELKFSGGVGGTATEFRPPPESDSRRSPRGLFTSSTQTRPRGNSTAPSATVVGGVCTAVEAGVGMPLEPECRPGVTLKTAQGTVLTNVPVGWAITLGGGATAPEASVTRSCGSFGPTATTTTNANGKAGACWTLGPTPGTNRIAATPQAGGDAPAGVTFNPASITFTATAIGAPTLTTVSCPVSVAYTGAPQTPCTASVTGPGLGLALTPTYTGNIVGTATASASYPGSAGYLPSSGSATFTILYVQSGCFASPIYSEMPSTKSFQRKGSNVPVKCTLLTGEGAGVSTASGALAVEDRGTDGLATPVVILSVANAFKASNSGNYSYGLDTSHPGFVSGHYYLVTATWNDGSTTTGWFYVR
jgi:hypothetical protein